MSTACFTSNLKKACLGNGIDARGREQIACQPDVEKLSGGVSIGDNVGERGAEAFLSDDPSPT